MRQILSTFLVLLAATCDTGGSTPTPDPSGDPTPAPGTGYGDDLDPVACTVATSGLPATSQMQITTDATYRYFSSNGIPDHAVGPFPNSGNPNTIAAQSYNFRAPLNPSGAGATLTMSPFGIAINGVVFDPFAAEYWQNNPNSGWQYEPLSGSVQLGVDCNYAHVQPNGAYHYHGIPEGILTGQGGGEAMYQVGYAADGYPVYARYGYRDADDAASGVRVMVSSYRLKQGTRPSGPGGTYDGSFVQDYEYVEGLGDLDECNGRVGQTPDFGETYHYVLTDNFPFIPRCFNAAPDQTFVRQPPPQLMRGGRPMPPRAGQRPPRLGERPAAPRGW